MRTRFAHFLSILLSALLAWPAYVPFVATEPVSGSQAAATTQDGRAGLGLHSRDRKSILDQGSVADLGDDFEDSDGRDELPFVLLALGHPPLDLPSLVPSTIEVRSPGSVDRPASFLHSPHLRC